MNLVPCACSCKLVLQPAAGPTKCCSCSIWSIRHCRPSSRLSLPLAGCGPKGFRLYSIPGFVSCEPISLSEAWKQVMHAVGVDDPSQRHTKHPNAYTGSITGHSWHNTYYRMYRFIAVFLSLFLLGPQSPFGTESFFSASYCFFTSLGQTRKEGE